MNFGELKAIIREDHLRLNPVKGGLFRHLVLHPTFRVVFWFRVSSYLQSSESIFSKLLYPVSHVISKHYQLQTGIQLSAGTEIGGGLVFPHYSNIVINRFAKIGKNCAIYQGVTVGSEIRPGKKNGAPVIGNKCILFTGAKIIGNISVGDNVIIGAGAVVINNIPDNSIVAGVPAKVVSNNDSNSYFYYQKI